MSDDFSEPAKRALAARVGNLCSNAECRALTSGPQDDPAKALNLGVAAHVTAASPGGPRYDPDLLPEERDSPTNGIWLCQNCAKLIDNDPARFTVEILLKWKSAAESEARNRIGKTATSTGRPAVQLALYSRVRIEPVIPRRHEQSVWVVRADDSGIFSLQKSDSLTTVDIPESLIAGIHRFRDPEPTLIQLTGRLQWISDKRHWRVLSEMPIDLYGVGKNVDQQYPARQGLTNRFRLFWSRLDHLQQHLDKRWSIFYDDDGRYLRVSGPDVLILISEGI
jgi:hypothetical protein